MSTFQNGDFLRLIALVEDKTDGDHYAISRRVQELMCRRQPAIRWLLDVICGSERARRHRVVRIYHPEVLDLFGLERRPGFRYSLEEMAAKMNEFQQQVMKAEQLRQTNVAQLESLPAQVAGDTAEAGDHHLALPGIQSVPICRRCRRPRSSRRTTQPPWNG